MKINQFGTTTTTTEKKTGVVHQNNALMVLHMEKYSIFPNNIVTVFLMPSFNANYFCILLFNFHFR